MTWNQAAGFVRRVLAASALLIASVAARGDTVSLKNGMVFRTQGAPDKDGTLLYLWDGLKKTVIRDSKVERIVGDNAFRTGEKFQLVQPLVVHAGAMPKEVISVDAGAWNDKGRRSFKFVSGRSSRPNDMEQAIVEIGPHLVKYRGVDGFWLGQMETSQVPRTVMMSLLTRVEQTNPGERERVVRFLMDAGWYSEARQELDRLILDFPKSELGERAAGARVFIVQAEASQRRNEIEVRRRAQQYKEVDRLLRSFTEKEIGTELLIEVRDVQRRDEEQRAADVLMAADLRRLEGRLPSATRGTWKKRVAEAMQALEQAPDAVRDRFAAWRKARTGPGVGEEAQFALALSGFVVGHEEAVSDLKPAETLWKARELIRSYLNAGELAQREELEAKLESLEWPAGPEGSEATRRLDLATRIAQLMPPSLHDGATAASKTTLHKLEEDGNLAPTEYAIQLPPEYHPLRSYPAIVVLHSGKGPQSAIDQWSAEAARRGFIVIAPEYNIPGQEPDYRYTPSEHAAVELALRDARKRYAVDSDRVFVAGQLTGGNMAWDFSLAHPDLFAGVIVVSGFPAKYVPRYLPNQERLPLFFVIGDLAPAANEFVFARFVKPMVLKTWDVTYAEYHRRGLEEFPEQIPTLFDWMERHRREPVPKQFETVSARPSDDRFYGVVVREFAEGRTTAPEAVEMLGQNLKPATIKVRSSNLSNLLNIQANGVKRLDVWLSPKLIDFKRNLEVRINNKRFFRGMAKLDLRDLLEDLRIRGDRKQVYWLRVAAG